MTQPTLSQALEVAFELFKNSYGSRWAGASAEVWAMLLEQATPEEVLVASKKWCQEHDWPPTPKDLLQAVPRFCRCGRCWPCHHRAVERAGRALERGSAGADFDTPERLLPQPAPAMATTPGGQKLLAPTPPPPQGIRGTPRRLNP